MSVRVFSLLTAAAFVAAACSTPKRQHAGAVNAHRGPAALGPTAPGATAAVPGAAQTPSGANPAANLPRPGAQGPLGYSALNPNANAGQAARVGALFHPQTSDYQNGNPNTWAGVTKDTIKAVFSMDLQNCGVNTINAISQAGGNFATAGRHYRATPTDQTKANAESKESIENIVRYWNDHVRDVVADSPQTLKVMDRFNTPGHQYYGRHMDYQIIDGGSFQCPDKQRSAALQIKDIKPFAVYTNDIPEIDGSGWNMAQQLYVTIDKSVRPMHYGSLWQSDSDYARWAPFDWTQFISGTASAKKAAGWICDRLNGPNPPIKMSPNTNVGPGPRKFGLLYPDTPGGRTVAGEFKSFISQDCGLKFDASTIGNEFAFSQDPSRAPDEGGQIMTKFRLIGVTSVIYLNTTVTPLFHLDAAKAQGYHPEWLWTATGYTDSTTVQRLYDQSMLDKNSLGISAFGSPGGFGVGAGDSFWLYHSYHQVSPNDHKACDPSSDAGMNHDPTYCKAPGAIVTWYYTFLDSVGGYVFAGPGLTPYTATAGLQAYPLTRYSASGPTDNPRAALVGAGPGQYFFITDAEEWRWRANYISPSPESKKGWVEWTDCQRHYYQWSPEQLSLGWEKNTATYNTWCGSAAYAPANSPEKDDYPHWTAKDQG